jgi:hypothetical protein
MSQKLIVTTSPWKNYKTGKWMLSAVFNIQLNAVGDKPLSSFPDIMQWMDKIEQAIFYVQWNNQIGVEIKPISTPWDEALYKKLFTNNIMVDGYELPNIDAIKIKSYPYAHVANFILDTYKEIGNLKMDELPKTSFFATQYQKLDNASPISLINTKPITSSNRQAVITDFVKPNHPGKVLARQQLDQKQVISYNNTPNAENDFGQALNFHNIGDKITPKAIPSLKVPQLKYHEIISTLTSYPVITRKLGLVIDFELPTPPPTATGTVRIIPTNLCFENDVQITTPGSAFEYTGAGFYLAAKPGSFINKGMLKVNTSDFNVVQFDTDSAAIKLSSHTDSVYNNYAKILVNQSNYLNIINDIDSKEKDTTEKEDEDKDEGLPFLRSAGIALVKNGLAENLLTKLKTNISSYKNLTAISAQLPNDNLFNQPKVKTPTNTSTQRQANMSKNKSVINKYINQPTPVAAPTQVLYADDLVAGYRMDVAYADKPTAWYSLHLRKNEYKFVPLNQAPENISLTNDEMIDEGCIYLALTKDENSTDNKNEKVTEVLARWEGWSLSAPKPGRSMNDGKDEFKINTKKEEEEKYSIPKTANFRLQVKPVAAPRSLPKLRFGNKYNLKVRVVDIAGNSLPHTSLPENAGEAIKLNIGYLRYEPLPTPVLVQADEVLGGDKTKMRDRDGESLEHMVVRSNFNVDSTSYEANNPTPIYPENSNTPSTNLLYAPFAVRHIKAPRASQHLCELHGIFDEGFTDPTKAPALYDFITSKDEVLNENGDKKAKLEDPNKNSLVHEYLVDPMAAGVIFTMKTDTSFECNWKKGENKKFSFYFDGEVNDTKANDEIPKEQWIAQKAPKSFRIRLIEGSGTIKWQGGNDRELIIALPKSAKIELTYASFWRPTDVDRYNAMLPIVSKGNQAARAQQNARKSQHWMFSPWRTLRLTHAVQQPLQAPTSPQAIVSKNYTDTMAVINTTINVHGSSTDRIDIEAEWDDMIDDLSKTKPNLVNQKTHVDEIPILYRDKTLFCSNTINRPRKGDRLPQIKHSFNDTKHHMVQYNLVATSRYREYFTGIIEGAKRNGKQLLLTQTGFIANPSGKTTQEKKQLNILSSAKPAPPIVEYIIPSFNWIRTKKGNEMINLRTANVRIYLKRPWFSSGNNERLAVILLPKGAAINKSTAQYCSVWGKDPVYNSPELNNSNFPSIEYFPYAADYDNVALAEDNNVKVQVAAYTVLFDEEKQLHYADVPIDIKQAYFPMVRLCVARYQRHSLRLNGTDCCLSSSTLIDWLQVPAARATGIYFKGSNNVFDVAVRGTAAFSPNTNNISGALLPMFSTRSKITITIENNSIPKTNDAYISINDRPQGLRTTEFIQQYNVEAKHLKGSQLDFVERITLGENFATQPFKIVIREYELHLSDPLIVKAKNKANFGSKEGSGIEFTERLVFMDVFDVG